MKKLILASSILSASSVFAETELETQTVTATRLPDNVISDANFLVIDRADIEKANVQSLPELLSLQAGMQFTRNGGRLNTTNLYINGLDNKRITVLVNGERIGSGTSGTAAFQLISPEQVERIEVIKGARGALYGADAQGGVINIITRDTSGQTQISAAYGKDYTREVNARTSIQLGKTNLYLNAQHDGTHGYDVRDDAENDEDGHERYSINGGASVAITSNQNVKLDYLRSKGNYEYDGNNQYGNNSDFDNQSLSAGYQFAGERLSLNLSAGRSEDNSWDYKDSEKRSADDLFATTKNTANLFGRYQLTDQHAVIVGSDYQSTDIAESGTDYDQKTDSTSGLFLGYRLQNDVVGLELGARHDNNNRYGKFRSFNTALTLTTDSGDTISVSQATAFRTPTFNDLYYPGFGNPTLEPERSRIWSLSYQKPYESGAIQLDGQRAVFNNQITYNPATFSSENIGKTSVDSVTVSWNQEWTDGLSSKLSQEWVDAKNDETNKRLRRISPRGSKAIINYAWDKLSTQAEAIYYEGSPKSDGGERLASYSLLNLSVNYQLSRYFELGLRLDNLSDREYETVSSYNAPGRSWLFKTRLTF